jgi:hypothetical protein
MAKPQPTYTMDLPRIAWEGDTFKPDNWSDPVCNWLRDALKANGEMAPWLTEGHDYGPVQVDNQSRDCAGDRDWMGHVFGFEVQTALGSGFILVCPYTGDSHYVLVKPHAWNQWVLIAWYKSRGKTEALMYYENEGEGTFTRKEPCHLQDAAFIGHFLHTIQHREPDGRFQISLVEAWRNDGE